MLHLHGKIPLLTSTIPASPDDNRFFLLHLAGNQASAIKSAAWWLMERKGQEAVLCDRKSWDGNINVCHWSRRKCSSKVEIWWKLDFFLFWLLLDMRIEPYTTCALYFFYLKPVVLWSLFSHAFEIKAAILLNCGKKLEKNLHLICCFCAICRLTWLILFDLHIWIAKTLRALLLLFTGMDHRYPCYKVSPHFAYSRGNQWTDIL